MSIPPRSARRALRVSCLFSCVAALALAVALPAAASAQAPSTPADTAAVLLDAARDFEAAGAWEVAEALYRRIAERYPGTSAAAVAAERLARPAELRPDRSGDVELKVWSTTYGLWLGAAVPAALSAENPEVYGVGLLVGGPLGLLTARGVTRRRDVSEGQARAITWGGTWGSWQGLGWAQVLDLGEEVRCYADGFCDVSSSHEEIFASMIAGGAAGILVGSVLARKPVTVGAAAGATYGSLWGSWIGVAGATVMDLDDDNDAWVTTLLAGNAGLVAGALYARSREMSRNRVRLISLGGLVGALGGFGLDLIVQPDDERVVLGIPLATSVAGLAIGAHLTRDHDRAGPTPGGMGGGPALLNRVEGAWSLSAPLPLAARLPSVAPSGRVRWTPGLSVELLRATF